MVTHYHSACNPKGMFLLTCSARELTIKDKAAAQAELAATIVEKEDLKKQVNVRIAQLLKVRRFALGTSKECWPGVTAQMELVHAAAHVPVSGCCATLNLGSSGQQSMLTSCAPRHAQCVKLGSQDQV